MLAATPVVAAVAGAAAGDHERPAAQLGGEELQAQGGHPPGEGQGVEVLAQAGLVGVGDEDRAVGVGDVGADQPLVDRDDDVAGPGQARGDGAREPALGQVGRHRPRGGLRRRVLCRQCGRCGRRRAHVGSGLLGVGQ
ncbi:hypothetical protein [Actinomyces oris]|uniref:hypothetical protein n=1 Tax=Actinomyces oris TaxID=544580 RepID=UPI002FF89CF1